MTHFDLIIFILGLIFLVSAWLPEKISAKPISLAMIWLIVGLILSILDENLPRINLLKNSNIIEHLTEFVILISLLSAGLKLNTPMDWFKWKNTWCLLIVTMPVSIFLMTLLSLPLIGLSFPTAICLAALLSPTDPVLANDVQVGPPGKGNHHIVRFTLTSEAGLNDGLAFPFIQLACVFTAASIHYTLFLKWFFLYVLWELFIGAFVGLIVGSISARLILKPKRSMKVHDGFLAVALMFLAYGGAKLLYGNGFISVFIAAHIFRHYEKEHHFHYTLYKFSEQFERLLVPILLILLALFIYQGVLNHLTRNEVIFAFIFLFLIRPISGLLGLIFSKASFYNKLVIAVFGIRGIGSFYYLAYVLNHNSYFNPYAKQLWRVSILIVLISIIFHGMSSSLIFNQFKSNIKSKKNNKLKE